MPRSGEQLTETSAELTVHGIPMGCQWDANVSFKKSQLGFGGKALQSWLDRSSSGLPEGILPAQAQLML